MSDWLEEIKARAEEYTAGNTDYYELMRFVATDIPDLIAEVRRLRAELDAAKRDIEIALGTQRVCFACKNVIPCSNSITGEYGCDPKWRGLCAENGG